MQFDFTSLITYVGFPLIGGLIVFVFKNIMLDKINDLEVRMREAVTEHQVRQLITDRYQPLENDLKEIKENQIKLLDLYMETLKRDSK